VWDFPENKLDLIFKKSMNFPFSPHPSNGKPSNKEKSFLLIHRHLNKNINAGTFPALIMTI
jgi:hypothetical protein